MHGAATTCASCSLEIAAGPSGAAWRPGRGASAGS
uniref:Uncharacterized protein n=1 Tax=Setaria italica TaxID=4555 RepID=K3ZFP9_SETIT